ncbi:MAG: hypothetical protein ABSD71_03895 [Bacteroidales bacterium]|jgi:hypothetical protein
MKKYVFLLLAIALFTGCSKKSTNSNAYSNSLQLGTGIDANNPFNLTGVGTTFYANTTIYFRLESADDQGGSSITLQIKNTDGSTYKTFTYTNVQSSGHIFLSNFLIPDPGNYTATGIIVNGNKTVASTSFTIVASK